MTNKEAITYNKNLREYMKITDKKSEYKFLKENYIALDMAIKALEQQGCVWEIAYERGKVEVLDKIRAEVVDAAKRTMNDTRAEGLYMALQIIDKYKAESEDKE